MKTRILNITKTLTNFILEDSTPTELTKDELFAIILIQRDLNNWKVIASLCQKINKKEEDLLFLVYLAEALIKLKKIKRAKDLLEFIISNEKSLKEDQREENHFSAIMTDNSSEEMHFAIGKAYFISGKHDAAMFHLEIAAKKGFSRAYHVIGVSKLHGLGTKKNEEEAVKYFVQAAHYGDLSSYLSVAHALLTGTGIAIDEKAAFDWYEAGANTFGHPRCQFNLALCYEKGIGTEVDHEKANELYKLSSIQGDFMSQYNLGLKLIEGRDINKNENEGFKWIQKSALAGHKMSQYQLGLCFAKGIGTKQNEKKCFKWFKFSAENGFVPSFKTVGFFYQKGYGIKSDQKEGCKWLLRSANEAKDADSMIELAKCYKHGIGIEKDPKVALEWYDIAKKLVNYEIPSFDKL